MEQESSLPHSQEPATCPYPGSDFSSYAPIPLLEKSGFQIFVKMFVPLRQRTPSAHGSSFPTSSNNNMSTREIVRLQRQQRHFLLDPQMMFHVYNLNSLIKYKKYFIQYIKVFVGRKARYWMPCENIVHKNLNIYFHKNNNFCKS